MAFRIGRKGAIGASLKRILVDDLEAAIAELANEKEPLASRVHSVRRRLKRDRSLARLFEPSARETARELRRTLRDAGRALAGLREGAALTATARELSSELPTGTDDVVLAAASPTGAITSNGGSSIAAAAVLAAAAERLAEQLPAENGRRLLKSALDRARRKVRKGYDRAVTSRTAEDLHEWRKQIKEYGHLMAVAARRLKGDAKVLPLAKEAEELLGDDHDLSILRERVVRMSETGPKRFAGSVAIGRRRLKLQQKAFALGRKVIKARRPRLR
jgi:CHAD domain-containing protein